MKSGKLLSACMMVKDEEANIGRCLNSIKGFVDEIIIVDTGSTDDTINIAKSFGARVYNHPWQSDFSLHRNQSLSYCKTEWAFIIDADEELVFEESSKQLRTRIKTIPHKFPSAALLVKDIQKGLAVMQFNSARFFRRGQVKYEEIVHNQPVVKGKAVFCKGFYLKHYGYDLSPEQKQKKFERTHSLLMKQVELGELKNGFPYFYLCQLHAQNDQPDQAVVWGEKYFEIYDRGEIPDGMFNKTHYFTMVKQYMRCGEKEKAHAWLMRGHEKMPGDLDLTAAALEYGLWIGDKDLVIHSGNDFIKIYQQYEKDPSKKSQKFVFSMRPEVLSMILMHLVLAHVGKAGDGLRLLFASLKDAPPNFRDGIMTDLKREMAKLSFPVKIEPVTRPEEIKNVDMELTTLSI
jgi:glycosyltransferase involved in cell wall biosynthesis